MMDTLHRLPTIAFLAVSIFTSGLTVDFAGAQNTAVNKAASRRSVDLTLSPYLKFKRLTAEDGFSSAQTWDLAQDKRGFMWFGTADGLNRYDGAGVKVFRNDPDDPNSLGHNIVRALIADQNGDLWIGTWGSGLNQYDSEKDAFIRYPYEPDNPNSLSNNIVRAVYEDQAGAIWVGTMGGLNKLDHEDRQFTRYQHDPDDPGSLSNNIVWSVVEDNTGVLWVGTEGGLNRFDPKTEQFTHYRHNPDDPSSLNHDTVRSIYEDSSGILWVGTVGGLCSLSLERTRITRYQHDANDPQTLSHNIVDTVYEDRSGRLWVGTWGGGLNRFDRETATFTHYRNNPSDRYSLSTDTVWSVYEGRQGMLWIATDGGISILDDRAKPFYHYRTLPGNPNSLSSNSVHALYAGRAGIVWVGTDGGGLNKFDRQIEKVTHYLNDPSGPNRLNNDTVRAIYEDRLGLIWVGTRGNGLIKLDPDTESTFNYRHDAGHSHSLSHNSVVSIYEDRTGTLWLGTWGGGLNAFDRESEQFTRYQHDPEDPNSLSNNTVSTVFGDQAGDLWIGTIGGLNKFERETKTFTHYKNVPTDPQSLTDDSVVAICEDRTGTLWIGTTKGIDKFDRQNDRFTHYSTKNGLPSDSIWGILEDGEGWLWLSTANGLSRFDPLTDNFRNYTMHDGLQSNTFFSSSAYAKSRSGEMFFGGSNGFSAFYPDEIVDNPAPPPVLITDFQLANKPVSIGADSVLQKSVLETNSLVLSYRERMFSFEFVALNYRAPEQNRYKYRMEGFEKEWNEVDSARRFASYTNLDPGEYVFRVIGANNDGIWNEEGDSIRITVAPPWWQTWWFRASAISAFLGLVFALHQLRMRYAVQANRRLEEEIVERKVAEAELKDLGRRMVSAQEDDRTRIARELHDDVGQRLAATMIGIDMTQSSLTSAPEQAVEQLADLKKQLDQISEDLRQVSHELHPETLQQLGIAVALEVLCEEMDGQNRTTIRASLPESADQVSPEAALSLYRIAQESLRNIVQHAEASEAELELSVEGGCGRLRITDNGVGFEPQAQREGLGLASIRERARLLDGSVRFRSQPGAGTEVSIEIPLREERP